MSPPRLKEVSMATAYLDPHHVTLLPFPNKNLWTRNLPLTFAIVCPPNSKPIIYCIVDGYLFTVWMSVLSLPVHRSEPCLLPSSRFPDNLFSRVCSGRSWIPNIPPFEPEHISSSLPSTSALRDSLLVGRKMSSRERRVILHDTT